MKKVIIVGGGVAGLAAGKRLVDTRRFQVTLLEGASKIGGRVSTQQLGDHFVENGAQWIHGQEGNQVFQMANDMGFLDLAKITERIKLGSGSGFVFVTNTGKVVEADLLQNLLKLREKILNGPNHTSENQGSIGDRALGKFQQEIHTAPMATNEQYQRLAFPFLDNTHRSQISIDGSDNWFQASLNGHHIYKECPGNLTISWRAPACYSSLLGILLRDLENLTAPSVFELQIPDWIHLNKEVTNLEILSTGQVQATCADNTTYTGDHVICTMSLGVLKHSHNTLFTPHLPDRKILAIENLGIGCADKIHFDFNRKWWPDDILGFRFLWEDAGSVEEYWRSEINEVTLKKEVNGFPLWSRAILGFYVVPSHPTALCVWINGPPGKLVETLPKSEVMSVCMKICRSFLGQFCTDIPDPVDMCRSQWFTNPLVRGSYSFRQVVSEEKDVWASDLAEPICANTNATSEQKIPVICFAGEASHDFYYSTVHGAIETGWREADRLLKFS